MPLHTSFKCNATGFVLMDTASPEYTGLTMPACTHAGMPAGSSAGSPSPPGGHPLHPRRWVPFHRGSVNAESVRSRLAWPRVSPGGRQTLRVPFARQTENDYPVLWTSTALRKTTARHFPEVARMPVSALPCCRGPRTAPTACRIPRASPGPAARLRTRARSSARHRYAGNRAAGRCWFGSPAPQRPGG